MGNNSTTMSNKLSTLNMEFVCDNTGSMGEALKGVPKSAIEVSALTRLAMGQNSLKLGVVGDYDRMTPDNDKGGCVNIPREANNETIRQFVNKYMKPYGGGRVPEAYITYLHLMLQSGDIPKVLFWILDATPHGYDNNPLDDEGKLEKKFLDKRKMSQDWDTVCNLVKNAGVLVFTFSTVNNSKLCECYTKLGYYITIPSNTSSIITDTIMSVFYALIGQSQDSNNITYYYCERNQIKSHNQIEPLCKINFTEQLSTTDPEFVINTFLNLLDPLNPHSVMCLTTNPILSKYWRAICGKYRFIENSKYQTQCQAVMDKLSQCQNKLSSVDSDKLKKWIEESHNDSPIIYNMIKDAYQEGKSVAFIPTEMIGFLSIDDVLSLGRECKFTGVSKVVASIQLTKVSQQLPESEDDAPNFLPMDLNNRNFFSLIGNLLSPGLILSHTASLMIAVLSLNNKFLGERAYKYLKRNRGKWIDWSYSNDKDGVKKQTSSAFWPHNFFRLVKKLPDELLTTEECIFRDKFLSIMRITHNHDAIITIKCPLISNKLRPDVTRKRLCIGCNHERCFTIFPGNSKICGICISLNNNSIKTQAKNYGYKTDSKEILEQNTGTNWAQCYTCKGNYGITAVDQLKVRVKCHFCRQGKEPEYVECSQCLGHYLSPNRSAFKAMDEQIELLQKLPQFQDQCQQLTKIKENNCFLCPRCIVHPSDMIMDIEVKISTLIDENPQLRTCIPYTPYDTMINSKTKLWMRVLELESSSSGLIPSSSLTFNKYMIHNHNDVENKIMDTLLNHSGIATCDMCVSEVSVRDLTEWCGNCPNRACHSCINAVYGQFEIGKVVQQCNVSCPFCKSPPKYNVICNLEIRHLCNLRPTRRNKGVICQWDPQTIYASCRQCLCIKPALARECARATPTLANWICDDCTQSNQTSSRVSNDMKNAPETKQCPNCHVSIQRTGGCHHITCQCGTHWCWVCGSDNEDGVPFNSHSIYDHMGQCGGIFPGVIDADDDDFEDDEYNNISDDDN